MALKYHSSVASALAALIAAGPLFLACGSDDGNPFGGGGPDHALNPAEYFGLVPGRTITAGYVNYVGDSLRQFVPNSPVDAWSFTPVIGLPTICNGRLAYPVSAAPIPSNYSDPDYAFTLYFSADSSGLYWHGGSYCGLDLPLPSPGRIAPYPLASGLKWQTIGHAETDIDQCNRSVADTLNATCRRITNAVVRGNAYPEVFLIRIPFIDVPGHIGTRYYEAWIAPGYGPVRGASFDQAYEHPDEGFEFISYSP
ncbi:MAG TPA: hypothetical protein PLR32_01280 [candidate division Zixibacteria bacterium]|nr:hypothetical protein [candidate division Zixibacteria bacterium]MDD4917556.1 hypothetical protein [candidate division Zixibacteria bacterium]MDM7972175.1 hypothetical protein [candidate division Zixibacteria bacterium]HOD66471.1 hypothetical protein [candidate division Zixibacteria bacterium]HOZ06755.1 hypothetical protein [candidate division Zixibacteria bacterium]